MWETSLCTCVLYWKKQNKADVAQVEWAGGERVGTKLEADTKTRILISPGAIGSNTCRSASTSSSGQYVNNLIKHLSCNLQSLIIPNY